MLSPNRAILCLGANVPDASERLDAAATMLGICGTILRSTPKYLTAPEYAGDSAPYLNRIIELGTILDIDTIRRRTKRYQTDVRAKADCAPLVAVDIDIVLWNGEVLRPADAAANYFRSGMTMLK